MAKAYGRHRPAEDEIYCALMAERTGEAPENYRARPFDADLLTYAPSGHQGADLNQACEHDWSPVMRIGHYLRMCRKCGKSVPAEGAERTPVWPPIGFPIQNFGPHPQPDVVAWEGTGNDARPVYRKVSDAPQA